MKQEYKISRYNVAKSVGEDTWVFNTLTSGFVKMPTSYWNAITAPNSINCYEEQITASLLQAGIFVRKEENELQLYKYFYYKSIFQNTYLRLFIAPTMKCNFNCFYCFEAGNKNAGIMSQEVADNLIRFITSQKGKKILITWFGGEPLMGFERIIYICEKLKDNGVKYESEMITNGSLFTDSVVKRLPILNLKRIQISMDGLSETHDKRRIFKNGAPSFDLIVKNIEKLLAEQDVHINIKVTVDRTNPTAFGDLRRYFNVHYKSYVDKGQLFVSSNFVRNRTDFDKKGSCYDSTDELREQIKSFDSKSDVCLRPKLPKLLKPCMFKNQSMLSIDSQGYIYRCLEHLGVPTTKIGDFNTGKISNIRMAETTFQDDPFEDAECKACSYLPICGGGCPVSRHQKMMGKKNVDCCTSLKKNLAELLPYFYKYRQYSVVR